MSNKSWLALSLTILFILGAVAVSSFGAVTITLEQLSSYDPNNHYTTALKKGWTDVPILRINISNDTANEKWTSLTLTYTGVRISDMGFRARLYKGSTLINERSFAAEKVTFTIAEAIPVGNVSYDVKLDIASTAGSNKVDLKYNAAVFQLGPLTPPAEVEPTGYAVIDASPPALDTYAPITVGNYTAAGTYYGWYDIGTKILRLRFYDKLNVPDVFEAGGAGKVVNPLVRLVFSRASDATTQNKVDLSKITLRTPDNSPSTALTGATLLRAGLSTDVGYDSGSYIGPAESEFFKDPHDKGDNYFSSEVWIKLTPAQDAMFQHDILPEAWESDPGIPGSKIVEVYIGAGALTDAGKSIGSESNARDLANDFGNAIETHDDDKYKILVGGDTEPPVLVADRPVRFNYETKVLTLTFNESIDATPVIDVNLTKLTIRNYRFDDSGNVVVNQAANLVGSVVTEGFMTTVTITITDFLRDILKGDKSELVIEAGAVKDVAGNLIAAVPGVNVNVTPPLLSNTAGPMLLSGVDYGPSYSHDTRELILNFDKSIRVQYVDGATPDGSRIKIYDKNFPPNSVTLSLEERAAYQSSGTTTFKFIVMVANRDTISGWRATALRVHLDFGAFQDIAKIPGTDNYNSSVAQDVDVNWASDITPIVLVSSVYAPAVRRLSLRFNESISTKPADVILSQIWVFSATKSASLAENTRNLTIEGNTLIIYITSPDTDQHKIIVESVDPQVRVGAGAVKDLAGNPNSVPGVNVYVTLPSWATIVGVVRDSDGFPVDGAEVVAVTNNNEIIGVSGQSDADGNYFIDNITEAGNYNVLARKNGFKSDLVTDVVVNIRESTHVDLVLGIIPRRIKSNNFIMEWLTLGPLTTKGWVWEMIQRDFLEGIGGETNAMPKVGDTVKVGGESLLWKRKTLPNISENNLNDLFGISENAVGYLCLYFHVDEPQRTVIYLGSDDGIAVWLNGNQVWVNPAHRRWKQDEDSVGVVLQEGWNRLLVKVVQDKDNWGVSVRFPDVEITDYRFSPPAISPGQPQSYTFSMKLKPGLHIISLPLKPSSPFTARSLAQKLGATIVIEYDENNGEFFAFLTKVAVTDGFTIEGGKGYIVNLPEAADVTFTGQPWTNAAPAIKVAHPDEIGDEEPSKYWAFAVGGEIIPKDSFSETSKLTVTIKNLRTGAITICSVGNAGVNRYTAAFVNLEREDVVKVNDRIEMRIYNEAGELVSGPVRRLVTFTDLFQASMIFPLVLGEVIPEKTTLGQNYPNPFNPETWIPYQLAHDANVVLRIYNISGELVRMLLLRNKPAGIYVMKERAAYWDGKNNLGENVASGIYFYELKAGAFRDVKKMMVVR